MTETSSAPASLSTMRMAELQQLAASMGLKGISRMRKSELITAIRHNDRAAAPQIVDDAVPVAGSEPGPEAGPAAPADGAPAQAEPDSAAQARPRRRRATAQAGAPKHVEAPALELDLPPARAERAAEEPAQSADPSRWERRERADRPEREERGPAEGSRRSRRRAQAAGGSPERQARADQPNSSEDHLDAKAALMRDLADATGTPAVEPSERKRRDEAPEGREGRESWDEDEGRGGRRRRGRKRRDRDAQGEGSGSSRAAREDEVLLPVAGILDVADANHAYLRTSGYLPGPKDVYVSGQQIKESGLRAGDAITGWVREGGETANPGGGGRNNRRNNRAGRVKYNPLVSVEAVNGMEPERARRRPEFTKLVPLYPQEQLRLETTPKALTPRVIDLVAPIGKGQRGLIVSPPKAGKTIVLQQIANAIAVNNPEAHLMVVLVDARPEEVTDMQRTVKG